MKCKGLFFWFFLISFSLSAQIKGLVLDEKNQPIPYVNIWVENENIGTSTEENGTFTIDIQDDNKTLIFTVLGFETIKVKATDSKRVIMKTSSIELNEIVVVKTLGTKTLEIGTVNNGVRQAFENGPKVDIKFFPYESRFKKTKYIKKVTINTDSKIENASLKIQFYKVDEKGFPGEKVLKKDLIVKVQNGVYKNSFDVSDLYIKFPMNGIFVGFEKLMIENNTLERTSIDKNTNKTITQKLYYPFVLYNYVKSESSFTFLGGKWIANEDKKSSRYEPAISLILSN
jgi:hypothetical protein